MLKNTGKFIVFESIDGGGKSTQAELLAKTFWNKGIPYKLSPEPSHNAIGILARQYLSAGHSLPEHPLQRQKLMSLLFAADRQLHLHHPVDGVIAYLTKGVNVITTRYMLSSIAYNAIDEEAFRYVSELNKNFLLPDYTFYLNISPEEAVRRISKRNEKREIFENIGELRRVHANYEKAIAQYTGQLDVIDGTKDIATVNKIIEGFVF